MQFETASEEEDGYELSRSTADRFGDRFASAPTRRDVADPCGWHEGFVDSTRRAAGPSRIVDDRIDDVRERSFAERDNDPRSDQVADEVSHGVETTVVDEQRFEADPVAEGVDGVFEQFPDEPEHERGSDDERGPRPNGDGCSCSPTGTDSMDHVRCRGEHGARKGVGEMIPPPDAIVRAEHPEGVNERCGRNPQPLPGVDSDGVSPFEAPRNQHER